MSEPLEDELIACAFISNRLLDCGNGVRLVTVLQALARALDRFQRFIQIRASLANFITWIMARLDQMHTIVFQALPEFVPGVVILVPRSAEEFTDGLIITVSIFQTL